MMELEWVEIDIKVVGAASGPANLTDGNRLRADGLVVACPARVLNRRHLIQTPRPSGQHGLDLAKLSAPVNLPVKLVSH